MDQSIIERQDSLDTKSNEMSRQRVIDEDTKEECPEGITCGLKTYDLHNSKFKHSLQPVKGKDTPEGNWFYANTPDSI
jgi:hypothetical protein